MLIRDAHQLVVIVHVKANSAVPLDPPGAVPPFPTTHRRWVREGISVQHEQGRAIHVGNYRHCNEAVTDDSES